MAADGKRSGEVKRKHAVAKGPKLTLVEALTEEDLQSLRLNEADSAEFESLRRQVRVSREELRTLDGSDDSALDDARYDLLSEAQARMTADTTALVHFLVPRVMRLREGEAKRKWRSFVTKLQKSSKAT